MMLISLYTSRVVLEALGVEDFGVYQVIGGMVAMFAIISNSLSTAISRFITYEIGSGDKERLNTVFSTSQVVQLIISGIILLFGEIIGLWFLNTKMQIPEGSMCAANWVLQFSLISFCVNLLSVPYNACIIAHEHMKAFAYVSIVEAICKLIICYLLFVSPIEKLIFYAFLQMILAIGVRVFYTIYCHHNFEESLSPIKFHKPVFREMFGFAGWNFYTNTNYLLNNQGVNMLINVFFGVTFNAARGLANQVEGAVEQFVNSFTTAINPQITKSYAAGAIKEMHQLVYRGSKFSFFLMCLMALPLMFEADTVMHLWLTVVPEKTVLFVQLSLVLGLIGCFGNVGYTACMATGKIRIYSLVIGTISLLEFPIVWVAYAIGAPIETAYYCYIVLKAVVVMARMYLMNRMIDMPKREYVFQAIIPSILVLVLAGIPSVLVVIFISQSFLRLILSVFVGVASVSLTALYIGMTSIERNMIVSKVLEYMDLYVRKR